MRTFPFVALMLFAACRPAPRGVAPSAPSPVVAGEKMTDYDSSGGRYFCRAPADWKALEDHDARAGLLMFGTSSGPLRGKVSIGILRYPDEVRIKTPQDYWASLRLARKNPAPLETRQVGDRAVFFTHYDNPQYPPHGWKVLYMNRVDVALIPAATGFFAVDHSAPKESYLQTLPIFDAVVASFKPKS